MRLFIENVDAEQENMKQDDSRRKELSTDITCRLRRSARRSSRLQSLNHVRQMAVLDDTPVTSGGKPEEIKSVYETRATGFSVHALVLASLALLPQLAKIPMPVVSGIFLYLGRKVT